MGCVADFPGLRWWYDMAQRHTDVLLVVDELGALLAVATTCAYCGGVMAMLDTAFSPQFRSRIAAAFVAVAASDLLLTGAPHAVLHAVWHVIALTLPLDLVLASKKKRAR